MRVSSLSLALLVVLACACSVASIKVSARPLNRDSDDPDDFAFESIDPKHHDKARETSKRVKELNNRLYDARVALKDTMISQNNKFRDLQHAQTKSLTDRLAYLSAVNELKAYENRLELAQRELGKAKSQTAKENREMKKVDANTAEYEKKLADVMGLISKVESDDKLTPEGKSKMIKTLQEEKTKYTHELIQLRFAKTNRTQEGGDSNRVGIVRNTIKAIKEEISRLQKKAEGKEKTADLSAAAQRKAKDEFLTANDKRLNAAETIASLTEDLYQVKRKLSYLSGYKHIQPLHLRSNLGSAAAHAASVVDLGEHAELTEASEASEEESSEESEAAASEESAGENSEN